MKRFLAISTSSPKVSVAVLQAADGGEAAALAAEEAFVDRNAEEATFLLLHTALLRAEARLEDLAGILCDVGPGSFTGVRVGVTIAKTLAWVRDLPVAGIRSFALIGDPPVAVPSRKGRYLVQHPSGEVEEVDVGRVRSLAQVGYGPAFADPTYPNPSRAALLWAGLQWVKPEEPVPEYVLEPGISQPKVPYPRGQE